MRTIASLADFEDGRRNWLASVVSKLAHERFRKLTTLADLNDTELALLVLHVGVGHGAGELDSRLVVDDVLPLDAVGRLISAWRSGEVEPRIARQARAAWLSVFLLGRDFGLVRETLLHDVRRSSVGRYMRGQTDKDLELPPERDVLLEAVGEAIAAGHNFDGSAVSPDYEPVFDCPESHLAALVWLLAAEGDEGMDALRSATALELAALHPVDDDVRLADLCQEAMRKEQHLSFSAPGGWPGSCGELGGMPSWLADLVLRYHRRAWVTTTGHVPGFAIVAESDADLGAIRRFSYQPRLGHSSDDVDFDIYLVLPDDYGQMPYRHSSRNSHTFRQLGALFAVGSVLVDVYRFDAEDLLSYAFSLPLDLPPAFREAVKRFLVAHEVLLQVPAGQAFMKQLTEDAPHRDLANALQRERSRYELLHLGVTYRETPNVREAFLRLLRAYAEDGRARREGGIPIRSILEEARANYHDEVAPLAPDDGELASVLGPGRAMIYIDVAEGHIDPVAVWHGPDGQLRAERFDCSETPPTLTPTASSEEADAWLSKALEPVSLLRTDWQISKVVISPSGQLDGLLLHDAMLRLGFDEASYAPSLRTLARFADATPVQDRRVLRGHASGGTQYLRSVAAEIEVVAAVQGLSRQTGPLEDGAYTSIHLSGHGRAGPHIGCVGIDIGPPEGFVSGAWVVANLDLRGTRVAVLSACSTGQTMFSEEQRQEQASLAGCFLEAGARVVISTSQPVNDCVAFAFSCVFVAAVERGVGIWPAYQIARAAARTGQLPPEWPDLEAKVREAWPLWQQPVGRGIAAAPDDWRLFLLSGQYWA